VTLERFQRDWNEKAARCVGRFVRDKQLGVLNHSVLDALPPPRNLLGRPPHQGRNFSKQRSITGQPRCSARQTPGGSGLHVRSVPQIRCSATMRIYLVANHPRRAAKLACNRPDSLPVRQPRLDHPTVKHGQTRAGLGHEDTLHHQAPGGCSLPNLNPPSNRLLTGCRVLVVEPPTESESFLVLFFKKERSPP